jgi:predicted alpha-1,2-mannosidase
MKKNFLLLFVSFLVLLPGYGAYAGPVDEVDPMVGTAQSRWMLYPGPSLPFGMVKLSPDNQEHKWKAGYDYRINNISGFSHIHSWVMGGLLMMPCTGPLQTSPGTEKDPDSGYRSRIQHDNESSSPGYYSVLLDDYGVRSELTTTMHAGFQRHTFPKSEEARVLIDLLTPTEYNYQVDWASVRKVNDTEIEGFSKQRTYDAWSSLLNEYTVHFVVQFNKPFQSFNGWQGSEYDPGTGSSSNPSVERDVLEITGSGDVGVFVEFSPHEGEPILIRTGISLVSVEQARLNLETEMKPFGWDFDAAHASARSTWDKLLSRIQIEGGSELDRKKFYTNFYRSYAARTLWSDVNGQYVDMCEKRVFPEDPSLKIYGCDAFWNTFWNLNQLWSLVTPDVSNDWVKSLIEIYDRGGWLPKGPTGIEYSSIMVASHEVALINSVYQKGIRGYDIEKAYESIRHVQTEDGRAHPCGGLVGNRHLKPYKELGYVPHGKAVEKNYFGSATEGPVSNTLEYAFDDWNVAQMAKSLGRLGDYSHFLERSKNFKNVFHPDTGFVQPRLPNGEWYDAGSAFEDDQRSDAWKGTGFIEGNPWQFSWFVPHDVQWLVETFGKDHFIDRLNKGFESSAESSFNASHDFFAEVLVNHGNQPNMQAAYLFNYAGAPWLTQKWSREIMDLFYGSNPEDGWPGDEDQGQMGAWFVMSAIGLFEMDGGGSTTPIYEIGSPLFPKATIHLDPKYYQGGTFTVEARGVSKENRYIQSASLNGAPLHRPWFTHEALVGGGSLILEMGPKPNKAWGSASNQAPPSMSNPITKRR